jgi:hypothetical protein
MSSQERSLTKQVFVAYAYNLYDKRDYRKIYTAIERSYGIKFIFADEKITNMHILQKIISYIRGSDFSLFDISDWNPNVTLELGIALALSDNWYICFNPEKTNISEVPSDIRGIDRIQYKSFSDLEDKLTILLDQWYPPAKTRTVDDYMGAIEERVRELLQRQQGLGVVEIAEILNMNKKMVQVVVKQMVEAGKLRIEGMTKAAKYFPIIRQAQ